MQMTVQDNISHFPLKNINIYVIKDVDIIFSFNPLLLLMIVDMNSFKKIFLRAIAEQTKEDLIF